MPTGWNISQIADAFSNAAAGHESWRYALDAISEGVGAAGAGIVPLKGALPELPSSSSCAEIAERYVRDGWIKTDPRFRGIPALYRKGFTTDLDFLTVEEINRSPYYQEWLHPFGLKWFAGLRIAGLEEEWVLSLHRSEAQGPFSEAEVSLLLRLSHDISASAVLANTLGFSRADAALEAFTLSGKAVVMLNRLGEVVRTNAAAEQMFDDDLRICGKRLVSTCQQSAMRLEHAVDVACARPQECFNSPVLLRRWNSTPVVAFVSPARGVARDIFSPCQTYVILVDPYQRGKPAAAVLQELFGLTRTEAVLAGRVSRGEALREIACAMAISYETARTHLRNVFAKTGLNDQADLVAFLLRLDIGIS
ncbi:helix-turn-helix transcriptional regulator [Agrobacterium sp. NPDC089420]|uniref:helix-turn-helix transcriptional regulator n=1 Tax=Agrobacterium sp. NPDC089420 TaxID=3363918 RepID=UPI00384AA4FB